MYDLIYRQAAIKVCEHHKTEGLPCKNAAISMCIDSIEALPPAQPEIIRCKDCEYRGEAEDGEYNPEDIVCAYWMSDGLSETDYCSYAERRTDE